MNIRDRELCSNLLLEAKKINLTNNKFSFLEILLLCILIRIIMNCTIKIIIIVYPPFVSK